MAYNITISKSEASRINNIDFNNIGFGKVFSDHMFLADWDGNAWTDARIIPYGNFTLSPATSAIHYGQSIFEGMKAFRNGDDAKLFRPLENWSRLNKSAERMVMPQVPQELFMQGLTELVKLDKQWIPDIEFGSLYIRPFMFATDDFIGVKPSDKYCFAIFTCPVGPYYSKPLKVKVEEVYSRAAPGGVGFTKCAGNYGGALYPTKIAQEEGFDQVLWTDPVSHTLVEETGTTNFFAVFNDKIVTPSLRETMLAGITRDSVIKVLNSAGYNVEERGLTVEELIEGITNGTVKEMFITGTAATLIHVTAIGYRGKTYELNESADHTATEMVTSTLKAIRTGELPDIAGWMTAI